MTKEQIKAQIARLHDDHGDALPYAALIEYLNSNLGQQLRDDYTRESES